MAKYHSNSRARQPDTGLLLEFIRCPELHADIEGPKIGTDAELRVITARKGSPEDVAMADHTEQASQTDARGMRSWIVRHPIATFLVLAYATTAALAFVPRGLTEPGLLPGGATPHGVLENVLGSAVPAFLVTAVVNGRVGVRDLARRSFKWRGCPCAGMRSAC
jgi:hypothetical protein